MTVKEYLEALPVGDIVGKRALDVLRRVGLIWTYSQWGYLENLTVLGSDSENRFDGISSYTFPNRNAGLFEELHGYNFPELRDVHNGYRQTRWIRSEMTKDEICELIGGTNNTIEYKGIKMRPKYFSGCFKPYLIKIS